MKAAFHQVVERNAVLASKLAVAFAKPVNPIHTKQQEFSENETSCTFSIYNLSKLQYTKNETNLSFSMIEVAKNTLSLPNSNIQNEINKSTIYYSF